jgi:mRNA interferase MazF
MVDKVDKFNEETTYSRFDIVLVKLNPTIGSEIQKTRPCIIVSPNEMNALKTLIVAPMTSKGFNFIFRPKIKFENKNGLVLLDQIRAVDKTRIVKIIGTVGENKSKEISKMLVEIFEY